MDSKPIFMMGYMLELQQQSGINLSNYHKGKGPQNTMDTFCCIKVQKASDLNCNIKNDSHVREQQYLDERAAGGNGLKAAEMNLIK